jgi:ketosteroid isomerase-like protein
MTTSNIEAVHDELAVIRLVNRYTDAINRRDWDTLGALFCADGVWDVGGADAAALAFLFTGREQVVTGISGMATQFDFQVQTNHAVVVNVAGDRATASSTVQEILRTRGTTEALMVLGMYADEIVREGDGAWRFARRTFRYTYVETIAAAGKVLRPFS